MSKGENIPVYRRLVQTTRVGFLALDTSVQNEIVEFIKSRQHTSGGFTDRAGNPDLYYSLFGLWLSLGTKQNEALDKLKKFAALSPEATSKSPVEDLARLLIQSELEPGTKKQSVFQLYKTVFKKGRLIELSYQFFLLSLVVDATGKNKSLYYFLARIWLFFYKPKGNIPCSLAAALVYARKIVGLRIADEQTDLLKYSKQSGGFRAFESVDTSDSLSTGVALFVLKECAYDLRIIAPGCLDFIQENYETGAFLSGDGDVTKDLEYTFYGLLALGSVLNSC
ncbi:prenyltransferase/squalene oxidase repeat-containing protein [uncultured Draconibacterium sp.]|uniref:prenyltransferase/squalene oxidase repeat-containing protein n=1 Tax=uncultured Draconibacterium sp. TaxID=1573823 RepID=UPI0032167420